ncbi:adaptor protein MecA [Tuberibacillus sp. Marseille-P3662]|uniref:adaptor protein MecA n=1 Tax=Tuberibacillus sp. Marseille-P3662 TaxID=1965358 RepID=UPI000A1C9F39|nr:adaptor protein MecA [Tuberibacillus sp. Marseille-P3662]
MEIERVNDYTLKFFISYVDIEDRGFDREEIWYNRERSEELFWELMDEAHHQESFPLEGPLWIQVQAMDKGLEILVTRAQLSNDGSKLELPISKDKHLDIPVHEEFENVLNEQLEDSDLDDEPLDEAEHLGDSDGQMSFLIRFHDIEDLIALSSDFGKDDVDTKLYHHGNDYYLSVTFYDEMGEYEQENTLSRILEYGDETGLTVHYVAEYGKVIIQERAIENIQYYFG